MSQIFKPSTGGGGGGSDVIFITDSGTAETIASTIDILTSDTTANNANGILSTGSSNVVTILLTNRLQGTSQTIGAVTSNIVTFSLGATPATYVIESNFCAFEPTTPAGAGYSVFGTVRTDGTTAFLVGTPDKITNEDTALIACDVAYVVSGNNVILQSLGATGLTIDWSVVGYYVKVT